MQTLVSISLSIYVILIITLLCIIAYQKIDVELNIKLEKRDVIILIITSTIAGTCVGAQFNIIKEGIICINTLVLIAYLMFMSYTDQKTSLLYTSASIMMIILELIISSFNYKTILSNYNEYIWIIIIILVIMYIMSKFRLLGMGDVLIYIVVSVYLIQNRSLPAMSLIINILLTNILFIITYTVKYTLHRKKQDKHQPLTIFIFISTLICCVLTI